MAQANHTASRMYPEGALKTNRLLDAVNLTHHRPLCVRCQCNYVPERNGVLVRLNKDAIIVGDLWQCPVCEARMVNGFARNPITRHDPATRDLFAEWEKQMGDATVKDRDGDEVYG